jgi:hypothetical protein
MEMGWSGWDVDKGSGWRGGKERGAGGSRKARDPRPKGAQKGVIYRDPKSLRGKDKPPGPVKWW